MKRYCGGIRCATLYSRWMGDRIHQGAVALSLPALLTFLRWCVHFTCCFGARFFYITFVHILFCLSLEELRTSRSCYVFAKKPLLHCTGSFFLQPSLGKLHRGFNIRFKADVFLIWAFCGRWFLSWIVSTKKTQTSAFSCQGKLRCPQRQRHGRDQYRWDLTI